jgi:hypothetical protein
MVALIVSCCKGRNPFNLKTEFSTSLILLDHGKSEKQTNIWIHKLQYLQEYKMKLKINRSTIKNFNKLLKKWLQQKPIIFYHTRSHHKVLELSLLEQICMNKKEIVLYTPKIIFPDSNTLYASL